MPPSILPAGAQGGTSASSTGAALRFVSCIRLLGCVDLPERLWMIDREDPEDRYLRWNSSPLRYGERVIHTLNEVEMRHML